MTTTTTDAINETLAAFCTTWAAQDADGFAALYTEDTVVATPGVFNQGRADVRDFMIASFAGRLAGTRIVDTPLEIRMVDQRTAVVISSAGVIPAGADQVPDGGRRTATWVLSEQDGKWLIAAYSNTPAN